MEKDLTKDASATPDELTEAAVSHVLDLYQVAYDRIFRMIQSARRDSGIVTASGQRVLLREIGATLARFASSAGGSLERALYDAAKLAAAQALRDVSARPDSKQFKAMQKYAEQSFRDAYGYIVGQTARMLVSIRQMLRQDAAAVFRRVSMDGIPRKSAYLKLREQAFLKDPAFHFVDRAGRRWDSKVYFETLVRTVMAATLRESYTDSLISSGHDLAQITLVGSRDGCRGWEGRVVSLTGATPGYPTLSQAVASGQVFHPRCRHRLIAYHP